MEYDGHTILRLERDGSPIRLWERPGCGPSALAGSDLLVTCYDENSLVLVSATGETKQVHDRDDLGMPFVGPNDLAADAGGVFMSASGPWETAPIVGKIL